MFPVGRSRPARRRHDASGAAVIGALTSIAVAVWVLHRTLKHDSRQLQESQDSQRDLQLLDRRNAAWGDLVTALLQFTAVPPRDSELRKRDERLQGLLAVWAVYLADEDSAVEQCVRNACRRVVVLIGDVMAGIPGDVIDSVDVARSAHAQVLIDDLVTAGTAWHRGGSDSEEARSWLMQFDLSNPNG